MLHLFKNKSKENQTTSNASDDNPLKDDEYLECISSHKERLKAKKEKWEEEERENSVGIYKYNINLDQYEQVHPSIEYTNQLLLVMRLETLILEQRVLYPLIDVTYNLVNKIMKQNFNQEEYDCDAFKKIRKDLKRLETPSYGCCCIL